MKICCITNAHAGTAKVGPSELKALFAEIGMRVDFPVSKKRASIAELTTEAIKEGYDVVVAAGGDGTVNAVAGALMGTSVRLGILPLGTLNHFAKDIKIPLNIEAAMRTIATGQIKMVDVGEVNGKIFVNNSSLGLYPSIVRLREAIRKSGHHKWSAFFRAAWETFVRFPRLKLELKSPAAPDTPIVTPIIFVGNNVYEMTLANLGGRNALDQGNLWVVVPLAKTRWQLVSALFALVRGRVRPSDVFAFEAGNLIVNQTQTAVNVALDGEVLMLQPPLHFAIRPRALRVIVPVESTQ
jgi:diacylglycerol kinase family enzyme